MKAWIPRHPAAVWSALALVVAAILIAIWPTWVLRYGRVFAWPVVAAAIAIGFRTEIGALFKGRRLAEAQLPGERDYGLPTQGSHRLDRTESLRSSPRF